MADEENYSDGYSDWGTDVVSWEPYTPPTDFSSVTGGGYWGSPDWSIVSADSGVGAYGGGDWNFDNVDFSQESWNQPASWYNSDPSTQWSPADFSYDLNKDNYADGYSDWGTDVKESLPSQDFWSMVGTSFATSPDSTNVMLTNPVTGEPDPTYTADVTITHTPGESWTEGALKDIVGAGTFKSDEVRQLPTTVSNIWDNAMTSLPSETPITTIPSEQNWFDRLMSYQSGGLNAQQQTNLSQGQAAGVQAVLDTGTAVTDATGVPVIGPVMETMMKSAEVPMAYAAAGDVKLGTTLPGEFIQTPEDVDLLDFNKVMRSYETNMNPLWRGVGEFAVGAAMFAPFEAVNLLQEARAAKAAGSALNVASLARKAELAEGALGTARLAGAGERELVFASNAGRVSAIEEGGRVFRLEGKIPMTDAQIVRQGDAIVFRDGDIAVGQNPVTKAFTVYADDGYGVGTTVTSKSNPLNVAGKLSELTGDSSYGTKFLKSIGVDSSGFETLDEASRVAQRISDRSNLDSNINKALTDYQGAKLNEVTQVNRANVEEAIDSALRGGKEKKVSDILREPVLNYVDPDGVVLTPPPYEIGPFLPDEVNWAVDKAGTGSPVQGNVSHGLVYPGEMYTNNSLLDPIRIYDDTVNPIDQIHLPQGQRYPGNSAGISYNDYNSPLDDIDIVDRPDYNRRIYNPTTSGAEIWDSSTGQLKGQNFDLLPEKQNIRTPIMDTVSPTAENRPFNFEGPGAQTTPDDVVRNYKPSDQTKPVDWSVYDNANANPAARGKYNYFVDSGELGGVSSGGFKFPGDPGLEPNLSGWKIRIAGDSAGDVKQVFTPALKQYLDQNRIPYKLGTEDLFSKGGGQSNKAITIWVPEYVDPAEVGRVAVNEVDRVRYNKFFDIPSDVPLNKSGSVSFSYELGDNGKYIAAEYRDPKVFVNRSDNPFANWFDADLKREGNIPVTSGAKKPMVSQYEANENLAQLQREALAQRNNETNLRLSNQAADTVSPKFQSSGASRYPSDDLPGDINAKIIRYNPDGSVNVPSPDKKWTTAILSDRDKLDLAITAATAPVAAFGIGGVIGAVAHVASPEHQAGINAGTTQGGKAVATEGQKTITTSGVATGGYSWSDKKYTTPQYNVEHSKYGVDAQGIKDNKSQYEGQNYIQAPNGSLIPPWDPSYSYYASRLGPRMILSTPQQVSGGSSSPNNNTVSRSQSPSLNALSVPEQQARSNFPVPVGKPNVMNNSDKLAMYALTSVGIPIGRAWDLRNVGTTFGVVDKISLPGNSRTTGVFFPSNDDIKVATNRVDPTTGQIIPLTNQEIARTAAHEIQHDFYNNELTDAQREGWKTVYSQNKEMFDSKFNLPSRAQVNTNYDFPSEAYAYLGASGNIPSQLMQFYPQFVWRDSDLPHTSRGVGVANVGSTAYGVKVRHARKKSTARISKKVSI